MLPITKYQITFVVINSWYNYDIFRRGIEWCVSWYTTNQNFGIAWTIIWIRKYHANSMLFNYTSLKLYTKVKAKLKMNALFFNWVAFHLILKTDIKKDNANIFNSKDFIFFSFLHCIHKLLLRNYCLHLAYT